VAFARTGITKFLQQDGGKLSRPVSIGFFTDSGLEMQQTPSRDGNALAAFLNQHQTPLRSIRRSQGIYGAGDRTSLSLRALSQLAEVEGKNPERKIVIWISPGWPLLSGPRIQLTNKQEQEIFNTIVSTSTLLRQSRVTLSAVDPSGTSDAGSFQTFYYEQFLKGVKSPKEVQFGNLALQVLATQSGGRVLNSGNDIGGEIQHCVRDISASYVLTFDPHPADGPNDYHAIEVKVGKPDMKAQTRYGYYAQPAQPHGTQ
jgi:VWFA-related protein